MAGLAGETARASDLSRVRVIKKAAGESVTSSIAIQDDDDFVVTLDAGKVYRIELYCSVTGATGGDFRPAWAVTGGVAQYSARHVHGAASAMTNALDTTMRAAVHNLTTEIVIGTEAGTGTSHQESFLVETVTSNASGTLRLRWAQGTSNATATTLGTSSFMVITEVTEI